MKITQLASNKMSKECLITNLVLVFSLVESCQKSTLVHPIISSTHWPASLDARQFANREKKKKKTSVRNLGMDLMWPQNTCAYLALCWEKSQNYCKNKSLQFSYVLTWAVLKKANFLSDDFNHWLILRSEKNYLAYLQLNTGNHNRKRM